MNIHPIKTEQDYENALSVVDNLWGASEDTEAGEKLDILLILIENYESIHHPIDPPDPIEAIKFRMEQLNLSRKDLESVIGSRGRVSEILSRKRNLSLNMIKGLHSKLHIPLESLIGGMEQHV
ncbi:MAG: helix-turn-helix domain-containing protein [Gammaproteobacteria bacterium]|nr:helix-turn-helix domain-containing protein [Gammaproteobacteria bacterium]